MNNYYLCATYTLSPTNNINFFAIYKNSLSSLDLYGYSLYLKILRPLFQLQPSDVFFNYDEIEQCQIIPSLVLTLI